MSNNDIPQDEVKTSVPPEPRENLSPEAQKVKEEMEAENADDSGGEAPEPGKEEPAEQPKPESDTEDSKPEDPPDDGKTPSKDTDKDDTDTKDDPKGADDDTQPQDQKPRTPRNMPVWKHKVAEKKWQEEKADLEGQIEKLKNLGQDAPPAPDAGASQEDQQKYQDQLATLAEDAGIDVKQLEKIIQIARAGVNVGLSETERKTLEVIAEKLPVITQTAEQIEKDRQFEEERKEFNSEFDKDISDLVKEEYPHATSKQIEEVRESLEELAFSERYAQVPLAEIYRGRSEFRDLFPEPKKSGETGGSRKETPKVDDEDVTEEDFKNMSPDDRIKFAKKQASKEMPNRHRPQ